MEALKEIANIAGKGGLYRIVKPSRTGVIVESLDEKKEKSMIGPTARVSVLKDISIYTDDDEQSKPLGDVFMVIYEKYNDELPITPKAASNAELADFMAEIVPEYDRDRVHMSDVKKMIGWYNILRKNLPEAFETKAEETPDTDAESTETSSQTAETQEEKA